MASGWHLHHSLIDLASGANRMRRDAPSPDAREHEAAAILSTLGEQHLAGLLAHARGMAALCTPTINGFGRFRPFALAPQSVVWGRDNRGALLRVLGRCGDAGTRIENRLGEPSANPYLYIAAQVHAGIDGIRRGLRAGAATDAPYAGSAPPLPTSLGEALDALAADSTFAQGFGAAFIDCFLRVKRAEVARHEQAADKDEWQRREYFSRF
jgi:glutamine synthetase